MAAVDQDFLAGAFYDETVAVLGATHVEKVTNKRLRSPAAGRFRHLQSPLARIGPAKKSLKYRLYP
jgi:hypothetical protein